MGLAVTPEQDRKITELYIEMFQMLFCYANAALGNAVFAEEAVQDTFRIACDNPDECLGSPNPKGWLLEVLKNVIRNMRRSFERRKKLVDKLISVTGHEGTEFPDPADAVSAVKDLCVEVLGEEDFRLFSLVVLESYTMAEAAKVCGIKTEACKKRIQRAKIKLQNHFKNFSQDLSP